MAIGSEVTQDNIYIQRGPFNKNSPMWWDGYNGQQTVVFDDYRPWWCPFSYLLGLLDRYPIKVQTKGGWINFVPAKIIITTPLDIESTFANFRTEEDIKQVKRRVHRVVHFCSL